MEYRRAARIGKRVVGAADAKWIHLEAPLGSVLDFILVIMESERVVIQLC